ncbi:uncharacterized protein LOC129580798 [Paramacrobiotus metropolitanus]|uniref:uncharacterized protein LOC129580798 n=1 Tax=Paramacrobiotus metropolitanus TaxID=2943436 RepID=UPI0024464A35|nr:uncharacterized protein LOC129580798 [Paramacrobiotus metropolitanus]XP_055327440.1 uncharacterized protein LOC129580798 [Paramacrobiotus metropolitanus]XP_055327441.1 uncharacterized protein LOC129580798 [Paramacrobiotus metropolitanus]
MASNPVQLQAHQPVGNAVVSETRNGSGTDRYEAILRQTEDQMQYRNVLNLFGHLAQKVTEFGKDGEEIDWVKIAAIMKDEFHVDERSPWATIFHSSGQPIKEMYKKLWDNHRTQVSTIRLHREYETATDAKCLELVLISKYKEWDRMEKEEGKRDYFDGWRGFLRDAIARRDTREDIAEKLNDLTQVLQEFCKGGLHNKYKDVVKTYFPYFKEIYCDYGMELPEALKSLNIEERIQPQSQNVSPGKVMDQPANSLPITAVAVTVDKGSNDGVAVGTMAVPKPSNAAKPLTPIVETQAPPVRAAEPVPLDPTPIVSLAANSGIAPTEQSKSEPSVSSPEATNATEQAHAVPQPVPISSQEAPVESAPSKEIKNEAAPAAPPVTTGIKRPGRPPGRPGLPSMLNPPQNIILKPEQRNKDIMGKDSTNTIAPVPSQDNAKQPEPKKRKVQPKGEEISAATNAATDDQEMRWKNFENLCNTEGKLSNDDLIAMKRGLLVSLFSISPTDMVDYDPFKLPVSDLTAAKYDQYIRSPKSIEALLNENIEHKGSTDADLTELMLIPLNALVFNSFPAEILNGSVDLLSFLTKFQKNAIGHHLAEGNPGSADLAALAEELSQTFGDRNRPPLDQDKPIILQEGKVVRRGLPAAQPVVKSVNHPPVGTRNVRGTRKP